MAVVLKLFLHARLILDYLPVLAVKCIITFCWSKLKFGQCLSKTTDVEDFALQIIHVPI